MEESDEVRWISKLLLEVRPKAPLAAPSNPADADVVTIANQIRDTLKLRHVETTSKVLNSLLVRDNLGRLHIHGAKLLRLNACPPDGPFLLLLCLDRGWVFALGGSQDAKGLSMRISNEMIKRRYKGLSRRRCKSLSRRRCKGLSRRRYERASKGISKGIAKSVIKKVYEGISRRVIKKVYEGISRRSYRRVIKKVYEGISRGSYRRVTSGIAMGIAGAADGGLVELIKQRQRFGVWSPETDLGTTFAGVQVAAGVAFEADVFVVGQHCEVI